ncbi:hypothetical protein ABT061_25300 [Streptosporangium sp. NPDC002544]
MQIARCAADAFPLKVAVRGLQALPTEVVYPQLIGKGLTRIEPPDEPYE